MNLKRIITSLIIVSTISANINAQDNLNEIITDFNCSIPNSEIDTTKKISEFNDDYISQLEDYMEYASTNGFTRDTIELSINNKIKLQHGDILSGFDKSGNIRNQIVINVKINNIIVRSTYNGRYYVLNKKHVQHSIRQKCVNVMSYKLNNQ